MYSIVTANPLVSPATAQELIDWARLDSDDPKITSSLLIATQLVISFLKLDLLQRTYTLTYEDWPTVGTLPGSLLTPRSYSNKYRIELPFTNLISITSVTVNAVVIPATDYRVIKGKPTRLQFDSIGYNESDNAALEVIYVAGYGSTAATVPQQIRDAIVMTAAYTHAHAGSCDAANAVNMSGASVLLTPLAVMAGLVI